MSRRRVLGLALGSAVAAACAPAARLRGGQQLRLVYYADVHARRSEAVATALERAGAAVAAQRADVVIGGGDAIEGGIGVDAVSARELWRIYGTTMLDSIGREVHHAVGNHDLAGMPDG